MEFIDHTGHIFSLPSYNKKPIGYEYEENPYIFWLDDDKSHTLSIKNYYIKPIKFLIPITKEEANTFENITVEEEIEEPKNPCIIHDAIMAHTPIYNEQGQLIKGIIHNETCHFMIVFYTGELDITSMKIWQPKSFSYSRIPEYKDENTKNEWVIPDIDSYYLEAETLYTEKYPELWNHYGNIITNQKKKGLSVAIYDLKPAMHDNNVEIAGFEYFYLVINGTLSSPMYGYGNTNPVVRPTKPPVTVKPTTPKPTTPEPTTPEPTNDYRDYNKSMIGEDVREDVSILTIYFKNKDITTQPDGSPLVYSLNNASIYDYTTPGQITLKPIDNSKPAIVQYNNWFINESTGNLESATITYTWNIN